MAYYFLEAENLIRTKWRTDLIAFVLLTGLALFLWTLEIDYLFSIIPVISALSFVLLMELFKKREELHFTLLARIGKVSYSMYLIHFIFAHNISARLAPSLNSAIGAEATLVALYIMSVSASFALALLSEKYIERQSVRLGKLVIKKFGKAR